MEKHIAPNPHEVGSIKIKQEIEIAASADRVFAALTHDISFWWGAPFLIGAPKKLVVEEKLGGMFYEDWGNGDGAIWGTVSRWKKNHTFEFTGRCGMHGAVHGIICFTLDVKGPKSTTLRLEHDAIGQLSEKTLAGYTYGWNDLLQSRLKSYVENGVCLGIMQK